MKADELIKKENIKINIKGSNTYLRWNNLFQQWNVYREISGVTIMLFKGDDEDEAIRILIANS